MVAPPMPRLSFAIALALLTLPALAQDKTDRNFQECPECPQMIGIPAGRFAMGSPPGETGRFDTEGPQHFVTVKAFALATTDVTTEEYLAFLRDTGYQPAPCNRLLQTQWHVTGRGLAYPPDYTEPRRWPAVCLNWAAANAYIAWLNGKARAAHPTIHNATGPYRLPSEAEWEYAARGGTTTARWWGADIGVANANCNGCGSAYDNNLLSPVDDFKPNAFGLYGMLGNAWQWTEDCWHPSYSGAPADARPWMSGDCSRHVLRGGSWDNLPQFVRAAARSPGGDGDDYSSLAGFRIARDLP